MQPCRLQICKFPNGKLKHFKFLTSFSLFCNYDSDFENMCAGLSLVTGHIHSNVWAGKQTSGHTGMSVALAPLPSKMLGIWNFTCVMLQAHRGHPCCLTLSMPHAGLYQCRSNSTRPCQLETRKPSGCNLQCLRIWIVFFGENRNFIFDPSTLISFSFFLISMDGRCHSC